VRRAVGNHFLFHAAFQQVIVRLQSRKSRPTAHFSQQIGFGQLPGRIVGCANVAHLAHANQVVQRAQTLFDGCFIIPAVQVVQIDMVALQTAQAGFDPIHDVIAGCTFIVGSLALRKKDLGSQHKLFPSPLECITQRNLRLSASVNIGCIDEVNAQVKGGVHHAVNIGLRNNVGSESIGPQPNDRNTHA
jgi:hypothetical protein